MTLRPSSVQAKSQIPKETEKLFVLYANELIEWNKKFNLTSITEPAEIRSKHFEDSLTISKCFDFSSGAPKIIDIGAGAGFPGIPLKIVFPNIRLTLIDSVRKKTVFLGHIVNVLRLDDVDVICKRSEDFTKEVRESFDLALCRALAPLNIAIELCLPFVRTGGMFIAMKGKEAAAEAGRSLHALEELGGKLNKIEDVTLPGDRPERNLVVIEKVSKTPEKFPRRPGMAKKHPL